MRRAPQGDHEATGGGDPDATLALTALCRLVAELAVEVGVVHAETMSEFGPGELRVALELALEKRPHAGCRDRVELELLELLAIALVTDEHAHPAWGRPDALGGLLVGESVDMDEPADVQPSLRARSASLALDATTVRAAER